MIVSLVIITTIILWFLIVLVLVTPGTDAPYGLPFRVAALWPFLLVTDKVIYRVMSFNHRIDSAKENLRISAIQLEAALEKKTAKDRKWHIEVAKSSVDNARRWLIETK